MIEQNKFIKAILVPAGTELPSRKMFGRVRSLAHDLVLRPAVFFLPAGRDQILYSPTQGALMLCSKGARRFLQNYHEHQPNLSESEREMEKFFAYFGILAPRSILVQLKKRQKILPKYEPTIATLLLTDKCNLHCRYCYSNAGIRGKSLDVEAGKAIIDLVINNAGNSAQKNAYIMFHGGGEPTLEWDLLKKLVDYANEQALKHKVNVKYDLNTNGLLIDREKAKFLKKNNFRVTIALDGFRAIQNYQRPLLSGQGSYDGVIKTLKLLNANGIRPAIRSTMTKASIGKIPAFIKRFTKIFKVNDFSLLTVLHNTEGRTEIAGATNRQLEKFNTAMKLIRQKSKIYDEIDILVNLDHAGNYHCTLHNNLYLTPDADISSCLMVDGKHEKTKYFIIGRYSYQKKKILIFEGRRRKLFKRSVEGMEKCRGCFAKYNCKGGCPVMCELTQDNMMEPMEKECAVKRRFVKEKLVRLAKKKEYKISGGMLSQLLNKIPQL